MSENVTVVGAGLVGSLLSIFLAKRGCKVTLLERRPDMRVQSVSAGRSINLAISVRGLEALKKVGLKDRVLKMATPMRGRMMHAVSGDLTFQPYGKDDTQYINSVSRGDLNRILMTEAEETGNVQIRFNQNVRAADFREKTIEVLDEKMGTTSQLKYERLIGTDGSASAIRDTMNALPGYESTEEPLEHSYKELTMPPGPGGKHQMETNSLHIWPRGSYMLIALPNLDGSFTCTLFLPNQGNLSFEQIKTKNDVRSLFEAQFPDSIAHIPELEDEFFNNPVGRLVTVRCNPWNVDGDVLILGDASHAIVPFFGQGMNCGFEDCTLLDQLLTSEPWSDVFRKFSAIRKVDSDAIADMAIENFVEMRDRVGDENFLLQKAVEKKLQNEFPGRYISRYSLVTFTSEPYHIAYEKGLKQQKILDQLCAKIESADQLDLSLAERLISSTL